MARRSVRSIKKGQIEEPLINLTPLIDVVFVILITFIVVAPLVEMERVELANAPAEPHENLASLQEASPITIHVHRDNSITLNNEEVTVDELAVQLRLLRERYPDTRPQLFHDRRGHFGVYQGVKNAAEQAGFQQMDIVLQPA